MVLTTVSRQRNVIPDLFLVLFLLDSSPVEPDQTYYVGKCKVNELLFPGVHYVFLQSAPNRVSFAYLVFCEVCKPLGINTSSVTIQRIQVLWRYSTMF